MRTPLLITAAVLAAISLAGCSSPTSSGSAGGPQTAVAAVPAGDASSAAAAVGTPATSPAPTASSTVPPKPAQPSATAKPRVTTGTVKTQPAADKPPAGGYGYSATADAPAAVAAAMKKAKADGRNVLLDFGASWCGSCQELDRSLPDPQVQKALAAFHFVQIDIGDNSTTNMNLLQRYDSKGSYSMPVLIVVTSAGKVLLDTNGGHLPSLTVSGFTAFLHKWTA